MEFQVLSRTARSQLLWPTMGISSRYSRSKFRVDLDFALDFCRTNDLRNCMVQKANAKNPEKNSYHYEYHYNDYIHVLNM